MRSRMVVACALGLVLSGRIASAIDVGDPVYSKDVGGSMRVEAIFENFDRDVSIDLNTLKVKGPGGEVLLPGDSSTGGTEEKLYTIRFSYLGADGAGYLDVGFVDDDAADGTPYVIGAGGRTLIYTQKKYRLHAFAAAHYVPSFDLKDDATDEAVSSGKISFYEATAGVLASTDIDVGPKARLVPYAGVAASMLRGDFDINSKFTGDLEGVTAKGSADIEEDKLIEGILGASLISGRFSARVEGRVIGDASISAAVGATF